MPSQNSAVVRATIVFFVGFARAIAGIFVLSSQKGFGLALMGGGFVVVVLRRRNETRSSDPRPRAVGGRARKAKEAVFCTRRPRLTPPGRPRRRPKSTRLFRYRP